MVLTGAGPATTPVSQVAVTRDGLWAGGGVSDLWPDGLRRSVSVQLVIPDDPVAATPALPTVDLTKPWATVHMWAWTEDHYVHEPYAQVTNPTAYSPGALTTQQVPITRYDPESNTFQETGESYEKTVWEGTSVEVVCDDGFYDFYRVTWRPTRWAGTRRTPWCGAARASPPSLMRSGTATE